MKCDLAQMPDPKSPFGEGIPFCHTHQCNILRGDHCLFGEIEELREKVERIEKDLRWRNRK